MNLRLYAYAPVPVILSFGNRLYATTLFSLYFQRGFRWGRCIDGHTVNACDASPFFNAVCGSKAGASVLSTEAPESD